ncbi:MAG TPA: glycogen/starch synthase [Candidatus Paceibacterota bacterium]
MKILFAASELTPLAKVGGLGDAVSALARALSKLGEDVSIILPRYEFIKKENLELIKDGLEIAIGGSKEKISLYKTILPKSDIKIFLIDNPDYLSTGPAPYFEQTAFVGAKEEIQRFVFFSKAVFELLKQNLLGGFDILHCNDWHAGALVTMLRNWKLETGNLKLKTIFTIHNLSNQGGWKAKEIDNWFLKNGEQSLFQKFGSSYNFIAEGIINADWVTTVSPTYAKEILTKKYGAGLEKIIKKRAKNLTGILNGIDYEFYNPETDPRIFKNFSSGSIELKAENKIELQKFLGLEVEKDMPLFGLVARLTEQKGIDFIIAALPKFIKKYKSQFVFLGRGLDSYEKQLLKFAKKLPRQVYTKIDFDEVLAHQIYAASDFFLMPSLFEPSGLGQMISMRYGTIPIVRETGGLKDSVKHLKTGFVFKSESASAFRKILELAWNHYSEKSAKLKQIQKNCLKENFDFSHSAKEYQKLYEKLLTR